jgi:signal peptidase I
MEPTIKTGSLIFVSADKTKNTQEGDIVTFSSITQPNLLITHRVIGVEKNELNMVFKTKGDANNSPDLEPIKIEQIKGKVIFDIPFLGYLSIWVRTPKGFIFLILLPTVYVFISQLFQLKKAIEEEVIKKYKIKKKNKPKKNSFNLLIILIPFLSFTFSQIPNTESFFSNTSSIENNSFSTGFWVSTFSSITNEDPIINTTDLNIGYTLNSVENLDYVQLCYSINLDSNFICPENADFRTKSGSFNFNADKDGLYTFYTVARTLDGRFETDIDSEGKKYLVQIDTKPPTTFIDSTSFSIKNWSGQNLLENGSFESGLLGWNISSSVGDHHIISSDPGVEETVLPLSGLEMFSLGFKEPTTDQPVQDGIYQIFSLPQNLRPTVSFSFRSFNSDTSDFSNFNVQILGQNYQLLENIINFGRSFSDPVDSGWYSISKPLSNYYYDQPLKLFFGVNNVGSSGYAWADIDDIKISTTDLRVGETTTIQLITQDLGSGVFDTSTLPDLLIGNNQFNFNSTDLAENEEKNNQLEVIVQPEIVLNHIFFNSPGIELFNNTSDDVFLDDYFIKNISGQTQTLTNISIGPTSAYLFTLSESDFLFNFNDDSISLIKENNIIDTTTYTNNNDNSGWKRSPDGIGTWSYTKNLIDTQLNYNSSSKKITFTVSNIPANVDHLTYEIIYTSLDLEKGIFGEINKQSIENSKADRELFLGTCSAGGTCTSDLDIGQTATVNLNQILDTGSTQVISKIFNL